MGLTKALLINSSERVPVPIPVMFNPPEYKLVTTNEYAEVAIPGLGSSLVQFVRGHEQILSMELFFDSTDSKTDVREFTERVVKLTALNPEEHAPPRLLFIWGSLVFPCVLDNVEQRFDYFSASGMPLRATLTVTLRGCDMLESLLAEIPLLSSDRTKSRVFQAGQTLAGIAAEEYGDPRKWRPIAEASRIDDPLAVPAGRRLTVPVLTGE